MYGQWLFTSSWEGGGEEAEALYYISSTAATADDI